MSNKRNVLFPLRDLRAELWLTESVRGEDVLLEPGLAVAGGEHMRVWHGDRLDHHVPAGFDQPAQGTQEIWP